MDKGSQSGALIQAHDISTLGDTIPHYTYQEQFIFSNLTIGILLIF